MPALLSPPPELLTRAEAADYLHVQPQTLAVWQTTRRYNIPLVKIGAWVFYRRTDLDAWLDSRVVNGVGDNN